MKHSLILIVLLFSSTVMAEDWSAQLMSPIPALRDKAEKQLIEMGPDSGVVLPDANQAGLPADVKRRIDRIRRAWDERSALTFLEPSLIDNLPTSSLRAWLEAAEKKTGNPIDFKRLDDKLLDAPIESPKSTQFWKAMDELALRYGLTIPGLNVQRQCGSSPTRKHLEKRSTLVHFALKCRNGERPFGWLTRLPVQFEPG